MTCRIKNIEKIEQKYVFKEIQFLLIIYSLKSERSFPAGKYEKGAADSTQKTNGYHPKEKSGQGSDPTPKKIMGARWDSKVK